MSTPMEVASLFATLELRDSLTGALRTAEGQLNTFGRNLDGVGRGLEQLGQRTALLGGAIFGGLGLAAQQAMAFESALTNVQAVTGATADQMGEWRTAILQMGGSSRYGPQAVAEAFYDIVGGVTDASQRLAIMNSAVRTAEAGQADLSATTNALISIMNSYAGTGLDAATASDVLTRTVGVGVGTMNEFAAALPQVTGLAASMGIEFSEVGAAAAFLTTRGFSAGEAVTQLRSMMTALLNPNEAMQRAFSELGVASGQAALEQFGLIGAFEQLQALSPTFRNDMAGTLGRVEALNGAIALLGGGASDALGTFSQNLNGVTEASRAIQNADPTARFEQARASFQATAIQLGSSLLPALTELFNALSRIGGGIAEWVSRNPELASQLLQVAAGVGALLLGVGPLGTALRLIGGLINGVGAALGFIMSPIGGVIALVGLLTGAYLTNAGGFRDWIDNTVRPKILEFMLTWNKGVAEIQRSWDELKRALEVTWKNLGIALQTGLKFIEANVFRPLKNLFEGGMAIARDFAAVVMAVIADVVSRLQALFSMFNINSNREQVVQNTIDRMFGAGGSAPAPTQAPAGGGAPYYGPPSVPYPGMPGFTPSPTSGRQTFNVTINTSGGRVAGQQAASAFERSLGARLDRLR